MLESLRIARRNHQLSDSVSRTKPQLESSGEPRKLNMYKHVPWSFLAIDVNNSTLKLWNQLVQEARKQSYLVVFVEIPPFDDLVDRPYRNIRSLGDLI